MAKKLNPKKRTKKGHLKAAEQFINSNLAGDTIAKFNLDTWDWEIEEFDDLDKLIKDMKKRIECGVAWSTAYVYEALGVAVENWYNDYEPVMWKRTYTLYESPDMYSSGYGGHVFINADNSYSLEILENAEMGIHGATDEWKQFGDTRIGIWKELIGFLVTGQWNNSQYVGSEIDDAPMINVTFDAGVFSKSRKVPFGKGSMNK